MGSLKKCSFTAPKPEVFVNESREGPHEIAV
jgi:hypothetical protein